MDDSNFHPGAAKYGNFINYYQFNPPKNRISLIPENLIQLTELEKEKLILCLDIGCNTGDLTQEVFSHIKKSMENNFNSKNANRIQQIFIIGIDVDNILIERAIESNTNPNITYLCLDIMKEDSSVILNSYLEQFKKDKFDITFSFSITMWIHLNHGDDGLKRFLSLLCSYSENVLVEPQPWKCYKSAVRRMKRCACETFVLFNQLLIRDSVEQEIFNYFTGICNYNKLYETGETKWGRKMSIYKMNRK